MAAIGSPTWVEQTRGALSVRDQVRFTLGAIRREVAALPRGLRRRGLGRVLDADRTPPDTTLARTITELAGGALPLPLLRHSIRTWLWGTMLAEVDGVEYDDELFYVAALMHDLGLSEAYRPGPGAACFAVHGGSVARSALLDAGAEPDFARRAGDAIAAHFNVAVPLSWGAEAHLLHAGAHVDVVGLRLGEIATETVVGVVRGTRTGFADCFVAAMREERRLRPTSRAACLQRLGMERAIRRTTFPAEIEVVG